MKIIKFIVTGMILCTLTACTFSGYKQKTEPIASTSIDALQATDVTTDIRNIILGAISAKSSAGKDDTPPIFYIATLKQGARIKVQEGVYLITNKPLDFIAFDHGTETELISRLNSLIEMQVPKSMQRTGPDNISPDTIYKPKENEEYEVLDYDQKEGFQKVTIEAGTAAELDITTKGIAMVYRSGRGMRVTKDQIQSTAPVSSDKFVYIKDTALASDDVLNEPPGVADALPGGFYLYAGEEKGYIRMIGKDRMYPAYVNASKCIVFSNEKELLSADIPKGRYLIMTYSNADSCPPDFYLGMYPLKEKEGSTNILLFGNKEYPIDEAVKMKNYREIN